MMTVGDGLKIYIALVTAIACPPLPNSTTFVSDRFFGIHYGSRINPIYRIALLGDVPFLVHIILSEISGFLSCPVILIVSHDGCLLVVTNPTHAPVDEVSSSTGGFLERDRILSISRSKHWTTMWYEIIPSFAIITGAMALPGVAYYHLNKAVLGNPYRRDMRFRWDRVMYSRDRRLTGDPYKSNSLESIPDK